jgi:dihydrofolate reductase
MHAHVSTVATGELGWQGRAADAFLTGRVTFEQFRAYWPHQADDPTGISDYLNRVQKYVVSATLAEPGWEPTAVLRGPLREEITALKSAPGRDIVVTGSITLVHALIAAGLVDEYRLFVYPWWPCGPGFPPGTVDFGAHAAAELDPYARVRQSFSKLTPAG